MEDIDRIADEIAEVAAHLDAATHRLLTLLREFDERAGWAREGALSCAHWLSWRIGLDLAAGRERVRVARALGALPRTDEALRRGEVSYSKVRAMTRVATPANEEALLELARTSTASELERVCRRYRSVMALSRTDENGGEDLRSVERTEDEDGMVVVRARLRPEEADLPLRAIDAARRVLGDVSAETSRVPLPSRADALMAIAESFLAGGAPARPIAPRCEVVLHVEPDTLAATTQKGLRPPSPTGCPFPRRLRGGSRATARSCRSWTVGAASLSRWAGARARSRPHCVARSCSGTAGAASPAARTGSSWMGTISDTGRGAARRRSGTSCSSAGGITVSSTKGGSSSAASRTGARVLRSARPPARGGAAGGDRFGRRRGPARRTALTPVL